MHQTTANFGRIASKVLLAVSFILFLYCLSLPAYEAIGQDGPFTQSADWAFAIGWLAFLVGVGEWFANPFLLLAWILTGANKHLLSATSAGISLAIALNFLSRDQIPISEAPTYGDIIAIGSGYWVWIASIVVVLVASILGATSSRRER